MKNLILFGLLIACIYQGWNKFREWKGVEPLYTTSYVAVYGRDSCGWTQKMIKELKAANVSYIYHSVDDSSVANVLHQRMNDSGISTRRYNLPVIDVNGHLSVRPESGKIILEYFNAL